MMAVTIQQNETATLLFPATPSPLSDAAAALAPATIWQRIESYTVWRWTPRAVNWVVEGPGEWHPPLAPTTISTVEVWSAADVWETATLNASPLGGYILPHTGPFRFSGTVGAGDVPEGVKTAFIRLAEYMAAKPGKAGATRERIRAGSIDLWTDREAAWLAKAMQNSGAADLLRTLRKV
jgi:hypothetical protein